MEHPEGHLQDRQPLALVGGPAVYLVGSAIHQRIVYGNFPAPPTSPASLLSPSSFPIGYVTATCWDGLADAPS